MKHFHKKFYTEELDTSESDFDSSNPKQSTSTTTSYRRPIFENKIPRMLLNKNALKCKHCDAYALFNVIKIHHQYNHGELPFKPYKYSCKLCDFRSVRLTTVKDHMLLKHPDSTEMCYSILTGDSSWFQCSNCKTRYNNLISLRLHIKNKEACSNARVFRLDENNEFVDALSSDYVKFLSINPNDISVDAQRVEPVYTARKSTTTTIKIEEGFSFYGTPVDNNDLSKIITTIEVMGVNRTMSVKQLSEILDIFPEVVVEDCENKSEL